MSPKRAADRPARASREDEVRELYRALLERWNERDAKGFAALFADDGISIGFDGSDMTGPAEIEATLGAIFASHPTGSYVAKVRGVRAPAPDVAVLHAVVGMVPRGGSELNPAVNSVQTVVAARRGGAWRIAHFQNTPAAYHGRPEKAEALSAELRELVAATWKGVLERP
jgi:uncharacterized protein (TIGR02246 family)